MQPKDSKVTGFTNHFWNGISSDAFGRIVAGIIASNGFQPGVQHIVPSDEVTKDQLVRILLNELGREDVHVTSSPSKDAVNRTLATTDANYNLQLFREAGYRELPSISQMVHETVSQLAN